EGTAGTGRLVVARRQRAHRAEPADPHRRDGGLRAAGDHRVGVAAADDLERVADGMRRRGARGAGRRVRALGAEPDGDLPRGEVDDGGGDEERRDAAGTAVEQRAVLALDRREPADAGGDVDAHPIRVGGRDLQAAVVHRELRRRDGVLDEDVHLLDIFLLDELQRVEVPHLSRNLRREVRDIEARDAPDPAAPREERAPVRAGADAHGGHQPDPGHDNPPVQSASTAAAASAARVYFFFPCVSMYSTASLTRVIFSASSSGISIPNSSSKAITSSTVSSESAPRSSTNEASAVTSSSSTPSCSTMMAFTLSATAIPSS